MATTQDCVVVRGGGAYTGKQALDYTGGISAESTGSRGICMHLLTIPPGGKAKAHLHEAHETAIYMLSGTAKMKYGEGLARELAVSAGEFLYIPAGMPHQPFNDSTEPATAVLARTDPNEQESVVLLPELEDR